ncbi:L-threonylcarbamoyladenylate synthase [Natroniella sulfidigena]|uniref:L-threonylcarbamoyladenylate synthase n=1 Tax=Natroniella sulfidigena TaxID=723921 RepID=UPI00200A288E|nr:L-threonylcarbamoyladenylate synthase [Natroniella sulfidigena]MCK8816410.1 L-threonylcarbamoyladenylate synthase [Natroniella sulfidigena]
MKSIEGTKIFDDSEIKEAADLLQQGKLVAFPTETVYGLGANALDEAAVKSIFTAKGRPSDNPLIVHIAEQEELKSLVRGELTGDVKQLIANFWPGPLTIVLPKNNTVPAVTTGGLETIAVRMPQHPVALKLIKAAQLPVAAPSANLSGKPSPTLVEHVIDDLAGKIDGILAGGQTGIGVESTVVDLSHSTPVLLRPGGVTYEQLTEILGEVEIDPTVEAKLANNDQQAISPGMKYKHYSPQAEVILVEGKIEKISDKIKELIAENYEFKVGVMVTNEFSNYYQNVTVKEMGSRSDLVEISTNIFKLLREFDDEGVDKIIVEGLPVEGLGLAIMNRLRKSAAYQIIEV